MVIEPTPTPAAANVCDGQYTDAEYQKLVDAGLCYPRSGSPTPTPQPESVDPTPQPTTGLIDYNTDDDDLIEISNLAQLDSIRYDLDVSAGGDGKPGTELIEPTAATGIYADVWDFGTSNQYPALKTTSGVERQRK